MAIPARDSLLFKLAGKRAVTIIIEVNDVDFPDLDIFEIVDLLEKDVTEHIRETLNVYEKDKLN